jgi:hypothetical protein
VESGAEGGEKRLANRSRSATPAAEQQTEARRSLRPERDCRSLWLGELRRAVYCGAQRMKGELAKKWLGKLTKLNTASGRRKCRSKAPHRSLLLLCPPRVAWRGCGSGSLKVRVANYASTSGFALEFWRG